MTKSYQSYMDNVNYDIYCQAKYMLNIDLKSANSMNS